MHIHFDGRDFNLATTDKRRRAVRQRQKRNKHRLSCTRTGSRIGSAELEFSLYDEPVADDVEATQRDGAELDSYKKLYEFSERLMAQLRAAATLLDALMDAVIEITNADKGFLVLLEGETLGVKVARNLQRENIADAVAQLSDSIIAKVVTHAEAA